MLSRRFIRRYFSLVLWHPQWNWGRSYLFLQPQFPIFCPPLNRHSTPTPPKLDKKTHPFLLFQPSHLFCPLIPHSAHGPNNCPLFCSVSLSPPPPFFPQCLLRKVMSRATSTTFRHNNPQLHNMKATHCKSTPSRKNPFFNPLLFKEIRYRTFNPQKS